MDSFQKNFTQELLDDAKRLALVMKMSAFGLYSVFRVDEKRYFSGNTEKIMREKPVLVTDDEEIVHAIELLAGNTEGVTPQVVDNGEGDIRTYHYFVVEKQKPDWRAALALVEQIIGKAETRGKLEVSGTFSLLDLHKKHEDINSKPE